MGYTLGIPSDGQSLGNSKPQVRGNFTTLFNAFAVNHVSLDSLPLGKHRFVEMPEVADQTTVANEIGLYCKEAQSFSNLFWRQEDIGALPGANPDKNQGAIIQMTNVKPNNAQKGASFLPGGLLIQWDKGALISGSTTFNFAYQFTTGGVGVKPWSIVVTLGNTPTTSTILGVSDASITSTQFVVNSILGGSQNVYYIAIGPRT